MKKKTKLIFGVGINDANYSIVKRDGGKTVWRCPFYSTWYNMLLRCYSKRYHMKKPTYIGCSVSNNWLIFSNFKKWMQLQNWEGMQLDKDLIGENNKIYSQETCIFISNSINMFICNHGNFPIGAYWDSKVEKFISYCVNPFTQKKEYLGRFSQPDDAHDAWRKRKHEHALVYASNQLDNRIANSLIKRYVVLE